MADELVTIGRIIKPHGIRGEVAVDVLSDVPGRFDAGVEVRVGGHLMTISASRPHQGRVLLSFDHLRDRSDAERVRGLPIEAPPVDLSDTEAYFAHELIGMAVVDVEDAPLGQVSALIELPSAAGYDLLEVAREDGSTWLLPAVEDFVEIGEDEAGRERLRVVDPPDGLLEPDAAEIASEPPS